MKPETVIEKIGRIESDVANRAGRVPSLIQPIILAELKDWLVLQRDGKVCECGHEKSKHAYPFNEMDISKPPHECTYCIHEDREPRCTEFIAEEIENE
jgi:hypothetical protein